MDYLKNEYAEMHIEEGILFFTYRNITEFNLEVAQHIVAERLKLQREKSYPILCDITRFNMPDREARRYLAVEGSALTKAVAYLKNPSGSNHLTSFFIVVDQPVVPVALFTAYEEALTYLRKFV